MRNPRNHNASMSFVTRSSVGGVATHESFAPRGEPSAQVMEMLSRLHASREFTVENALKDFAGIVVDD